MDYTGDLVDASSGHDYDTGSMIALEMQNPSPPLD
jgi:hypothetical protein